FTTEDQWPPLPSRSIEWPRWVGLPAGPIHLNVIAPMQGITRDSSGVVHVEAKDRRAVCLGMGYAHAMDRALEMLLMRMLGQGRRGETLDSSDASLAIDRFFRRMNWSGEASEQVVRLSPETRGLCQAYCDGVNRRLDQRVPWELRLAGYRPEPW